MAGLGARTWRRFAKITAPVFRSRARRRVYALLAALAALLLSINGLNVLNSYVGREFFSALEQRNAARFATFAGVYLGVFAFTTAIAVFQRFTEERLGLFWRAWLTEHFIGRYLSGRSYLRIQSDGRPDNPDQRITEDVRTFTATTLSLLLIVANSVITLAAFTGVLWSITPWLVLAAALYAAFGTSATLLVGRSLISLNVEQLRREADLRHALVWVRDHADPIAISGGEPDESRRLLRRLARAVENLKHVIAVSRNLGFFITGYGYLTPVVPVLVVAPLYLRGGIEFGVIAQAATAFGFVVNACSIVVTQFQQLASFAAVIERVAELQEAVERPPDAAPPRIEIVEEPGRVAFEQVSLLSPDGVCSIACGLDLVIPEGRRTLIRGPAGTGRTGLLRAAAGLWTRGTGRIVRPPRRGILFLPQRPYLSEGPLRDQLFYGLTAAKPSDRRIVEVLRAVGLEPVLTRFGGLDAERDWPAILSPGEQQALAFARLLIAEPPFAFLDEATGSLEANQKRELYRLLAQTPTTYISASNDPALAEFHDWSLDLSAGGGWKAGPLRASEPVAGAT